MAQQIIDFIKLCDISSLFESDMQLKEAFDDITDGISICSRSKYPLIQNLGCNGLSCGQCPLNGGNTILFKNLVPSLGSKALDKYFPKVKELQF